MRLFCACDGCLAVASRLPCGGCLVSRGCLGCSWAPAIEKMLFPLALSVELRRLIGPAPDPVLCPCTASASASALRLTEEGKSKSEARGISSSSLSVPDIGRLPGSPAVSTRHHWLLRDDIRVWSEDRSIYAPFLPTNDLAASSHLSHPKGTFDPSSRQRSACPRDALVVDRRLWTVPAVVLIRRLPRRRLWLPRLLLGLFRLCHWCKTPRDRLGGDARSSTAPFRWLILPAPALLRVHVCLDSLVFAPICYSVLRFTPAIEAEDIRRPTLAPHIPSCSQPQPRCLSPRRRILVFLANWAKQDICRALSFLNTETISRLYSVHIRPRGRESRRIYHRTGGAQPRRKTPANGPIRTSS